VTAPCAQWSIHVGDLDPVKGRERAGSRPVLIVSSDILNDTLGLAVVLPLTTAKAGRHIYPSEVLLEARSTGLRADSIALGHQIRTVSQERLRGPVGRLDDPELRDAARAAMRLVLDLED
jgi:mRNA interferase MazF